MSCIRCPHHVRHGKIGDDKQSIIFKDHCGLLLKQQQEPELLLKKPKGRGKFNLEIEKKKPVPAKKNASTECTHIPFPDAFDYFQCETYRNTFETQGLKNGVLPTKDFQYSEKLAGIAVTDMELL